MQTDEMLCTHCGRMRLSVGHGRVWCYAQRQEVFMQTQCRFFVEMRGHPRRDVVDAVQKRLQQLTQQGRYHPHTRNAAKVIQQVVERALISRGFPVAPRLVELYLEAVV